MKKLTVLTFLFGSIFLFGFIADYIQVPANFTAFYSATPDLEQNPPIPVQFWIQRIDNSYNGLCPENIEDIILLCNLRVMRSYHLF
jgi:hypothetical protein